VDFAYYLHCKTCGSPNLVMPLPAQARAPTPATPATPAKETRAPLAPEPITSERHEQKVTLDPLRAADFVVDGELRGGHWPEARDDGKRYVASVRLRGSLPHLLIEPRSRPTERPRHGVRVPTGTDSVDRRCRTWTTGAGFPSRLLALDAAREGVTFGGFRFLEVSNEAEHYSALTVACARHEETLILAEAVVPIADALIERRSVFPDILRERTGVGSDEPVSPETVERLTAHVTDSLSWASGHAARSGDAIEAHLRLDEGEDLRATLRVPWQDAGATLLGVSLDAKLPFTEYGELELWAESKALKSRLRGLVEPRLGDEALDDALHVKGAIDRAPEVLATKDLCLRLATEDGRVKLSGNQLIVHVPAAARSHEELHAILSDVALLWRRLVLARTGVAREP
jgi:hypothetical protein